MALTGTNPPGRKPGPENVVGYIQGRLVFDDLDGVNQHSEYSIVYKLSDGSFRIDTQAAIPRSVPSKGGAVRGAAGILGMAGLSTAAGIASQTFDPLGVVPNVGDPTAVLGVAGQAQDQNAPLRGDPTMALNAENSARIPPEIKAALRGELANRYGISQGALDTEDFLLIWEVARAAEREMRPGENFEEVFKMSDGARALASKMGAQDTDTLWDALVGTINGPHELRSSTDPRSQGSAIMKDPDTGLMLVPKPPADAGTGPAAKSGSGAGALQQGSKPPPASADRANAFTSQVTGGLGIGTGLGSTALPPGTAPSGTQADAGLLREFVESDFSFAFNAMLNEMRDAGAAFIFLDWMQSQFVRFRGEFQGNIAQQALDGEIPTASSVNFFRRKGLLSGEVDSLGNTAEFDSFAASSQGQSQVAAPVTGGTPAAPLPANTAPIIPSAGQGPGLGSFADELLSTVTK